MSKYAGEGNIGHIIEEIKIKNIDRFITFCLSFTAVIMIGISIIELFPESFFTLSISSP